MSERSHNVALFILWFFLWEKTFATYCSIWRVKKILSKNLV